jgi:hypothetical protein
MLEWVPAGLNTGALSGAKASSSRTRDRHKPYNPNRNLPLTLDLLYGIHEAPPLRYIFLYFLCILYFYSKLNCLRECSSVDIVLVKSLIYNYLLVTQGYS